MLTLLFKLRFNYVDIAILAGVTYFMSDSPVWVQVAVLIVLFMLNIYISRKLGFDR